jgi:DNA polymerase-3 subunit alpha
MNRYECHAHTTMSNFRLVDSINDPIELINKAIEIGLKGISITDHEIVAAGPIVNKYYWEKIHEKYPDFKIGLGDEIYLVDERIKNQQYYHYLLQAKDIEGWHQLCRISTIAWLNMYDDRRMERVPTLKRDLEEIIRDNPGHLIGSNACLGGQLPSLILEMETARKLKNNEVVKKCYNEIIEFINWNKNLFGNDFYLEVQPAKSKEQIIVNKKMIEISRAMDVKIILTTDAHFLSKKEKYVHEALLKSKDGEREVAQFYEYAYLQTEDEIIENLQPSIPDAYEWMCNNTMEIYDKIEMYSLHHSQIIPQIEVKYYPKQQKEELKKYPNLYRMYQSDNNNHRYWVNQCVDKLKELNLYNEEYLSRLELEADIKETVSQRNHTNIFNYPLVLQHYIDLIWECGSTLGAGRGSAGGGLNHWLLGITQIDPVKYGLQFERYMNWDTDGLPDVDIDLAPSKRPLILEKVRLERKKLFKGKLKEEEKNALGCTIVGTHGTAAPRKAIGVACRGYRTSDYPDGIDNDIANYITSLIPAERGQLWTVRETYYGDESKNRKPSATFKAAIDAYPGLLDIVLGIEGLCVSRGSHASGIIINDENPYEFLAYMRTPSGDVVTQFDLHSAEWLGATKYDWLLTQIQDKIIESIRLLQHDKVIDPNLKLREVYNKYLDPMKIDYTDPTIWDLVCRGKVLDLFQFDSDVGAQGLRQVQPRTLEELSNTNGLIRLMAEEGKERPLDKFVKFKNNPELFENEMNNYGLNEQQKEAVRKYLDSSYGICISQEAIMWSLMDKEICGFSLKESNSARKIISKKKFDQLEKLHKQIDERATSKGMANYVWDNIIGPSKGYGFSRHHSLAYGMIAVQTLLLASKFNPIYWNTACLNVNSNSQNDENNDDEDITIEKKDKGANYDKIAIAIGKIQNKGIKVSCVDINKSDLAFAPDAQNNQITYGLKPLSGINMEILNDIFSKRPFLSFKDFLKRTHYNKTVIINLIKSGAFDEIEKDLTRQELMTYYLMQTANMKKEINLRNFAGLIAENLIPKELELQIRIYNFTKHIKANCKCGDNFKFGNRELSFLDKFFPESLDIIVDGETPQKSWDKIVYQPQMDIVRTWIKDNYKEILNNYNFKLFEAEWKKYGGNGNISQWEINSMTFYFHEHELAHIDNRKYGLTDFFAIDEQRQIDHYYQIKQNWIPIYNISRIAGTVIAKNDNKSNIPLLTPTGVVTVKFNKDLYAKYKKQISQVLPDGKKKKIESSWFTRGTKLIISGYRSGEDEFRCKVYKNTGLHHLYKITDVIEKDIKIQIDRLSANGTIEEDEEETVA